jgi:hypothetical protein
MLYSPPPLLYLTNVNLMSGPASTSSWLVGAIRAVLATPLPRIRVPKFQFVMSHAAASANLAFLRRHDFHMNHAIAAQPGSPVSFGSEFRPACLLEPVFQCHPLWPKVKSILHEGAVFPLDPIDKANRDLDNAYMIDHGNHKSAIKYNDEFLPMVETEVRRGFGLVLPLDAWPEIPNCSIAPLGMAEQGTIDETGRLVKKRRLTHDQSIPGPSGLSVNKRVIAATMTACMFGFCLKRIIHYIVSLRQRHPQKRVMVGKFDWKSAYRRAHLSGQTALESITQVNGFLVAFLRMPFGGKPCPSQWSDISEMACDLANALIQDPTWNPSSLRSEFSDLLPAPERNADDTPFAQARPMSVSIPVNDVGKADNYIDDMTPVCVDIADNAERCGAAAALVFDFLSRPLDPNESLPREVLLSMTKLMGEGRFQEIKTVLGWTLDTRRLLVSLSSDKFSLWSADIERHILSGSLLAAALETLVGRLEHVGYLIPLMRHFLGRIRRLKDAIISRGVRHVRLSAKIIADLRLFMVFLKQAHAGISMNLLTYRAPDHHHRADACEKGIGGYDMATGKAWRWEIPQEHWGKFTLNSLEFIASFISFWIGILDGTIKAGDCVLSETDSTSAQGWLYKSNFDDSDQEIQMLIARKMAEIANAASIVLYSQWLPGKENIVSDCLSRDHNMSDSDLVHMLRLFIPEQIAEAFTINQLPNEIVSFICSLVQNKPETMPSPKVQPKMPSDPGTDGSHSVNKSELQTHYLSSLQSQNGTDSLAPFVKPCAREPSQQDVSRNSSTGHAEPPWTTWHRPSELWTDPTPDAMTPGTLHSFYKDNTADIETQIPVKCSKKRSHPVA